MVWIQPAFGRMSANYFGGCARAIELGEEAVRAAAPLFGLSPAQPMRQH